MMTGAGGKRCYAAHERTLRRCACGKLKQETSVMLPDCCKDHATGTPGRGTGASNSNVCPGWMSRAPYLQMIRVKRLGAGGLGITGAIVSRRDMRKGKKQGISCVTKPTHLQSLQRQVRQALKDLLGQNKSHYEQSIGHQRRVNKNGPKSLTSHCMLVDAQDSCEDKGVNNGNLRQ